MGGYTGGKYDDDSNFKGSLDKYRKKKDHNDESEKLPNFNSNSSAKKPTEKRKTDTNEEVPKKAFQTPVFALSKPGEKPAPKPAQTK